MRNNPRRFLGIKFAYHDDSDEELLDESLHIELSRLQPIIRALSESFYTWEILDQDVRAEYDTRPYTRVWIPLEGMACCFPRKDDQDSYRYFSLEVSIVSGDTACFKVFDDVTENNDDAPAEYHEVAAADFEIERLGIRARDRYRPPVGPRDLRGFWE